MSRTGISEALQILQTGERKREKRLDRQFDALNELAMFKMEVENQDAKEESRREYQDNREQLRREYDAQSYMFEQALDTYRDKVDEVNKASDSYNALGTQFEKMETVDATSGIKDVMGHLSHTVEGLKVGALELDNKMAGLNASLKKSKDRLALAVELDKYFSKSTSASSGEDKIFTQQDFTAEAFKKEGQFGYQYKDDEGTNLFIKKYMSTKSVSEEDLRQLNVNQSAINEFNIYRGIFEVYSPKKSMYALTNNKYTEEGGGFLSWNNADVSISQPTYNDIKDIVSSIQKFSVTTSGNMGFLDHVLPVNNLDLGTKIISMAIHGQEEDVKKQYIKVGDTIWVDDNHPNKNKEGYKSINNASFKEMQSIFNSELIQSYANKDSSISLHSMVFGENGKKTAFDGGAAFAEHNELRKAIKYWNIQNEYLKNKRADLYEQEEKGVKKPGIKPTTIIQSDMFSSDKEKAIAVLNLIDKSRDDSDIMESLSFLPEEESKAIESKLSSLSSLVSDKEKELSSLMGKRELILNEYEDAKSSSKKVLKRMRYFDKIGDDDKARSLSKEFDKLNRIIKGNTKSGLEMRASKMAKWTPQGITSGQYYQDSVTKEILDLSNEIHVLNSQRNKLGG